MTSEERFDRIESNLERLSLGLGKVTERLDKFEVTLEVLNHAWNERFNKLWESQTIIMEAQNQTWQAIGSLSQTVGSLSQKIDKLTDTVDALVKGLLRPNGKE